MKPLPWLLLLLLTACAPALAPQDVPLDDVTPVIRGATPQRVAYGAFSTYYEVLGEGAPVVLVHGIGGGSSGFQYRQNAPALAAAGFRVFVPDLLGFGGSSRPELRYTQDLLVGQLTAFLEGLPGGPKAVVANGLSAAYAVRVAVERPELISKLVLIAPTGYERLARPQDAARVAAFDRLRGPLGSVLNAFLLDPGSQRFFLLDAYAGRESLTPEVLESYDRNLRVPGARWVVFSFISGNLDQSVRDLWPRVEQPTLILWGTEATNTPIGDAEDFLRARPQTRFLPVRGVKLLPNEDRPGLFNEALLDFLRE
ncbi:alpha/beta fold hydrolase [Truepera radiovictrix]|uniref:Alpha/beta hydrolase fold protein n=1 Tax=Truepera radiovictrix (strain DSM 17093 / CIP 108686 / LMG 22925 / RQ-24) TaxID=649638 RepID=D7CRZ2_TRURR|nr:alpha/beta hydrolase [Truepera radiovictrix]ADI15320.1 alpha/beta hydrolase fold protein [Truepera radiovictrix DSM 17093]WMT56129.1 alpha/beta hydrolase [Truepera radiovictrix]